MKRFAKALLLAVMLTMPITAHAEELPESVQIVTSEDETLLLKVAMGEAGNQGVDGMRYVISTILNRVDDSRFPDTISEVVNQRYQFYTGYSGSISDDCREALAAELQEQIDTEILWFSSAGWPQWGTRAFKHKDHWFSK